MVQKSGIIKRFLAGTHSNQILYLNSVSESEKIEDSKNYVSQRVEQWFNQKFHFKIFKYKVVVYDLFLLCGNNYYSLSREIGRAHV